MFCIGVSAQGLHQDANPAYQNAPQEPTVDINELLVRLQEVGPQTGLVDDLFTTQERLALKAHFRSQNRSNVVENVSNLSPFGSRMPTTLSTLFAGGNGGNTGGAVYFDITVGPSDITITDMETNTAEAGAFTMDIYAEPGTYVGNQDNPGFWGAPDATASGTGMGANVPSPCTLDVPLVLSANTTYAIALVLDASHGHDYTNGDGMNQSYSNSDVTIDLGSATNVPFTAPIFDPRVWNGSITYDLGGGGGGGGPAIAYGPENVNANFSSWEVDIPETMTSINPIGTTSFENSGAINLAGDTAYVLGSDGDFWEVDLGTGVYTSMGTVTPSTGGTWAGMELDRTSGTFYALSGNFTIDNHVHVFDPIAGTATALPNPTGMPGGGIALAIDGNGDMFAYDLVDDNFYSIDKTTGVANLVGPLDFDANFGQGMTYDPNSDQVYMSAFNNATFQAEWRIVDTSNGTTTLVGVLGASVPGGLTQAGWSAIPSLTPPDNDICDDAYAINCDDTLSGDTSDGNTDTNGDGAPDEWFRFVDNGGTPLWVTVSTCDQADYDTILTVYDACGGAIVAQNDDGPGCGGFTSELSFLSDGASTFYIAVDGFNGASGAFDLTVTCVGPPPNDLIMNSIDVDEIGVPYVDPNVAMPAATLENGNPQDCNIDGANGVWYNFVAAATGTAHAEIVSPAGSSYVVFFHAPNEMATEDDLVYMFQVGNQCAPATEADIITSGGQAYYVFVVNTGGATDILIDGELLSAADNTIAGFNFYPNPAQDVLNLTSVDTIEHVAIYNLLGQQVIGQQVDALSTQLNISSLATGAYLMKATVNGQVGTYKIIKR